MTHGFSVLSYGYVNALEQLNSVNIVSIKSLSIFTPVLGLQLEGVKENLITLLTFFYETKACNILSLSLETLVL